MVLCFVFFKQRTAYEMRISDWSSDVCSADLKADIHVALHHVHRDVERVGLLAGEAQEIAGANLVLAPRAALGIERGAQELDVGDAGNLDRILEAKERSEEHTSELQSLMRISYAVFCLKTKTKI